MVKFSTMRIKFYSIDSRVYIFMHYTLYTDILTGGAYSKFY